MCVMPGRARTHIPSGTVVSAQAAGREVERRGARAQRTVIRKLSSKGLLSRQLTLKYV